MSPDTISRIGPCLGDAHCHRRLMAALAANGWHMAALAANGWQRGWRWHMAALAANGWHWGRGWRWHIAAAALAANGWHWGFRGWHI